MMKLKYEIVYDNGISKDSYYSSYRFNPDGRPTNYSDGIMHSFDWTHIFIEQSILYFEGIFQAIQR